MRLMGNVIMLEIYIHLFTMDLYQLSHFEDKSIILYVANLNFYFHYRK